MQARRRYPTPAPIPPDEAARSPALLRSRLLDTTPDETLRRLARPVARVTGAPIALVSLVDKDRQLFLCRIGPGTRERPRDTSLCGQTIIDREPMIARNVFNDAGFFNNSLVLGAPNLRAYLGAPIVTRAGHAIGTLCALDTEQHDWTSSDVDLLSELASLAASLVEARTVRLELRDIFVTA